MQKKFLTNLSLLLFLNLLVKPFWVLGIDRSVQNAVGTADFGFYFTILNFSFLFNIFLDLGITSFNNRNIAQNAQLLNKHFSSILLLKILLGIVYVLITFVVGFFIGYDSKQFEMLAWIGFNQFLLSLILYLRSNISGLLLFKTDSVISVMDRLLMILFCSILLWGNVVDGLFKIEWFVYAQTAAYSLTMLFALLIVIKKSAFKKLNWNWPFILMILKKSRPFALLVLLMMIYNRIDSVMIERMLPGETGDIQVGVYAQAYRLLDAANMIAFLFAVLLLPIFSRMIKLKQSVEGMVKLSATLLFTISSIVAVVSYFYNHEIMQLLYTVHPGESEATFANRIEQGAYIFSLLMFGFIAISSVYVFGTLLTANGSMKQLNLVAATGVVISLTINGILIPRMQATGSAWASLSSQYVTAFAQMAIAVYLFRFRINYRLISILLIFVAGLFLSGYFSKLLPYDWKANLALLLMVAFVFSVLLRLLNIREFIRIVKFEKE